MKPARFMVIAGEPSGDLLAAELVQALRHELGGTSKSGRDAARFFGAGGPKLAAAGVDLAFDMTKHAIVGLVEVLRHYRKFKGLFDALVELALQERPDVILCVDFSGFNRRFARKIRWELALRPESNWQPRIVQYVSPQVWASRPGRAHAMARDFDLLLSIFPFEKKWYAERVPRLPVEFVGHPLIDRYLANAQKPALAPAPSDRNLLLLPGSRSGELRRHLPVMCGALEIVRAKFPKIEAHLVLPDAALSDLARSLVPAGNLVIQVGGLAEALQATTVAVASTGTVTLECAYFGVPTVALYRTSWSTYHIAKRIIQVKYLAMPNLLADEPIFPELIQQDATPEKIAGEVISLLQDPSRRDAMRKKLAGIINSLGSPGASQRAAQAVLRLRA